jgi:GPH family glycoside/pentoside/hexuronide:cation symporter
MATIKAKKHDWTDNPLLRSKIHSANVKLFPEALLGYLAGPALALFSNAIINGYLNRYYTDVLGLTSWAKTFSVLLPIISVIAVIAGNLLVGKLMEKKQTMAGKARPLLLVAFPLIIAAFFLLFFVPYPEKIDNPENGTLILILVAMGYNLYYAIAYPFYYVAHSALVNLSTRNSAHRGLLATASNSSGLAAVGLVNMVFPLFQAYLFNDGDRLGSYRAWRIFVIALVIATALGLLLEYLFTRERITEESFTLSSRDEEKKGVSTSKQAKACVKDKYWWIILIFFLLYQLGGSLKNNSGSYYTLWLFPDANGAFTNAYGGQVNSLINTVGIVPSALGIVLVWPLANRFGKAKTILFGSILAVLGGVLGIFWGAGNVPIAVVSYALKALGSAPAMYISLALLSDVLDHQEAVHGFRTDGFTMSIYGAIMIGCNGIANGIINALLSQTGYDASLVNGGQSSATNTALSWIFFGGETIGFAAIAGLFIFMNVEKFSKLDHAEIIRHQKAECEAEGIAYVEPSLRMANEQAALDAAAEDSRREELKARCAKRGLHYEEEEKKVEAAKAKKDEAAAAKKAAADAKKKAKEEQAQQKKDEAEAERKARLETYCQKNGLIYQNEETKYEEAQKAETLKKASAEEKKQAKIQAEFEQLLLKANSERR